MMRRALPYLAAAILLGVVVYAGLRALLRHQVDAHLQSVASATPTLEVIDYNRLEIQLAPLGLVLREVILKPSWAGDPITVRRATLSDYRSGRPLPHRFPSCWKTSSSRPRIQPSRRFRRPCATWD